MLSGGITEKLGLDPNSSPEEIDFKAKKMRNCLARGSLLGCSIPTSEKRFEKFGPRENYLPPESISKKIVHLVKKRRHCSHGSKTFQTIL